MKISICTFFVLLLWSSVIAFGQDTTFVTIRKLPSKVSLTMNTDSIYLGQKATLTASGCAGTVTWSTGQTAASIQVSPTTQTFYSAFCTSAFGCVGVKDSLKVLVRKALVPKASPTTICAGDSSVLTVAGCTGGTLTWNNGGVGTRIVVKPNVTTQYSVTCTQGTLGTSQPVLVTVNVNATPTVPVLTANPQNVKTGESVTLAATGCSGTITWAHGKTGASITETLTKTTVFSAFCTSSQGCKSPTASVTAGVDSPIPIVNATPNELCEGQSLTLKVSGCSATGTYEWRNASDQLVNSTSTYTLTVTGNQTLKVVCKDSAGTSQPRIVSLKVAN